MEIFLAKILEVALDMISFGSKQELHLSGQKYMMGAFLDCVAPFNCQGKKL